MERTIDKISIRRVMTSHPITISFQGAKEAVEQMIKNNISSLPVVDNGN